MNKAQKLTIVITLILMTLISMFPPVRIDVYPAGRKFVFLGADTYGKINLSQIFFEFLSIALLGGAIVILLDRKKSK